ncbi:MAG TPA: hypothetical protein VGD37_22635 [Kofleriaceae bacterium]
MTETRPGPQRTPLGAASGAVRGPRTETKPAISRVHAGLAPSSVRLGSSERSADDRLESMMTDHRDAMLMLREAVVYEYFKRGSDLAGCGAHAIESTICWVRFQCVLHGQLMMLRVEDIDCGKGHGSSGATPPDETLPDCIRAHLKIGDPLGIPAEAAEDLGDYVGPLEVPLTYSPG